MQICTNKYVFLSNFFFFHQVSKFDKCISFYIIKIQGFEYKLYTTCTDSHGISNISYFFWISLKNFFLWGFPAKGTRVENNGNWGFYDHIKRFFFFPPQTPESSLGYGYWISYLKLNLLLEGQVQFLFWRLQLTRLEYFCGGCVCHYYFLVVC